MVKRNEEKTVNVVKGFKGGPGELVMNQLVDSPDELLGKGRVFAHTVVNKGCGVGWHVHEGDGEFFYILKGEAEFNDNGTVTTVRAGDVTWTGPGEGHALTNHGDEPLEMIALVVYA